MLANGYSVPPLQRLLFVKIAGEAEFEGGIKLVDVDWLKQTELQRVGRHFSPSARIVR